MGACECPGGLCLHLERARPGNENNEEIPQSADFASSRPGSMTFDVGGRQERVFEIRLAWENRTIGVL